MSGIPTPVQAIDGVHHKFNYDNIFIRTVIAGVINILNDRVYLIYRLSDTETKTYYVPFYYSMTGDERANILSTISFLSLGVIFKKDLKSLIERLTELLKIF